jgi:hypothetical protein
MGRCSRRRKERKKTENHTKEKRQTEPNWNRRVQSHDTKERKTKRREEGEKVMYGEMVRKLLTYF